MIFENGFSDTLSVYIDDNLLLKQYVETTSAGRAIKDLIITRPRFGKTVIRTDNSSCTQFTLKKGYRYIYISRSPFEKWSVTYSNYQRFYY